MKGAILLVALVALVGLVSGANLDEEQASFCQGCRSLMSFSQRFNSSSERSDYKKLATNYCELFYPMSTDFQQGPCPMFVEALFYVLDHTDAINHCDQIGACDQQQQQQQQVVEHLPSDDIYEYLQGTLTKKNSNTILKSKSDNVVCQFCESMVKQAQDSLSQPEVIDTVKSQLESVCEYLKVIDEEKQCKQLLDSYLDQAIDFIKQINPKQYCQSIQLCAAQAVNLSLVASNTQQQQQQQQLPTLADFRNFGLETSVSIGGKQVAPPKQEAESQAVDNLEHPDTKPITPNCMLCELVVKEMFRFLRNNRTEANIEAGLEQVCGWIYHTDEKRQQCDEMVKAYTRELVQLLQDETDPEMICMLLGQCMSANEYPIQLSSVAATAAEAAAAQQQQQEVKAISMGELISALDSSIGMKSARACLECKLFIKFLREQLKQPESRDEMEKWLQANVCERLPDSQLISSCEAMIHKEAPILIDAVLGQLNPHVACHQLGVCETLRRSVTVFNLLGDSQSLVQPKPLFASSRNVAKLNRQQAPTLSSLCDQCVQIVTQLDDYLSQHPIDQDVSVLIDKVCNKLPEGGVRGECTYIIKMFGASIVQAIQSMENPRQLCSKIYLCQA